MAYQDLNGKPFAKPSAEQAQWMKKRFRNFLPIIVDLETGGFNEETDALLEVAAVALGVDEEMCLYPDTLFHEHIEPFEGANMEAQSLAVNKIKPDHPLRLAKPEAEVLTQLFRWVKEALKLYHCSRAILVGHNAFFDLQFIKAAIRRNRIEGIPFHQFSTLDTVSLGALAYGQTILARIAKVSGMEWQEDDAHSAIYDAYVTAELFCKIINAYPPQQLES